MMPTLRISEVISFALSRQDAGERLKYVLLSLIFYPFLVWDISTVIRGVNSSSVSQAGDDIYPLF